MGWGVGYARSAVDQTVPDAGPGLSPLFRADVVDGAATAAFWAAGAEDGDSAGGTGWWLSASGHL